MEDIFVPIKIVHELATILFKEDCIVFYDRNMKDLQTCVRTNYNNVGCSKYVKGTLSYKSPTYFSLSVPTYEQVLKWFREKGYENYIKTEYPNVLNYEIHITDFNTSEDIVIKNFNNYEEARENLILELIKLYKKHK